MNRIPLNRRRLRATVLVSNDAPPQGAAPLEAKRKRLTLAISIAQISTPVVAVIGVALAAWGYVHTVLPVIQYQQLKEQAAKLEMDNSEAMQKLMLAREEQVRIATRTSELNVALAAAQSERDRLAGATAKAKDQELLAKKQTATAKADLKAQQAAFDEAATDLKTKQAALDKARWSLIHIDLIFRGSAIRINSIRATIEDKSDDPGAFILSEAKQWSQPYQTLLTAIDASIASTGKQKNIPASYYIELRKLVESKRDAIQCEAPDFLALRSEFLADRENLKPIIDRAVDDYIAGVVKQYEGSDKNIRITEDFRTASRRSIAVGKEFALESRYRAKINQLWKACDDKATAVVDEIIAARSDGK